MKTVKIIYVGPKAGISIDRLGVNNQRAGEAFEVPQDFANEKLKLEPKSWKLAETPPKTIEEKITKKQTGGDK